MPSGDRGRLEGVLLVRDEVFNGVGEFSDDPNAAEDKLAFLTIEHEQEGQFKVPTLRNVATHPPYFHGGHAETLEDVVRHYGQPELEAPEFGHREDLLMEVNLDDQQVADLVAFLESLSSGPSDPELEKQPSLPYLE
jgi:cytochrome c peroxidase